MSPARGGRPRKGTAKKAKPTTGRAPKSSAPSSHGAAPGGGRPRTARSSNARVVWPPQERTETAREAIEQMLREAGLARRFEPAVEREARAAGARAWHKAEAEVEDGRRRDLRELTTFTVDPATARDFDDAVSAELIESDTASPAVRVWVHIADVAAHVPPGSAIDQEARRRATSVYVPGIVEPMLPHALSSDACSLVPGGERLAVTTEMVLRGAQVESAGFYRSVIRSDMRLDYEQVDRIFAAASPALEPWGRPLAAARAAAAELQAARESSGALLIDSEEPEFSFDDRGNVLAVVPRPQTESHRLIEHLMIAANEAVARRLAEAQIPCLYRVHERPDPERIRRLVEQLASLGVSTPPVPDPLFGAQAADLVGEISRRVDAHVRRTGTGRAALSSLVLRSLKQACYSPVNVGHAGLHSACYCHFTSPIRRYPDLVCHRALLASLGMGERARKRAGSAKLAELGEWTSEREREAAKIEHKGDDIAACSLLEQVLIEDGYDQVFRGEVTGLIGAGAFIAFEGDSRARAKKALGSTVETDPDEKLGDPTEKRGDPTEKRGDPTEKRGDPTEKRGDPTEKRGDPTEKLGDPTEKRVSPQARSVYEGMLPVRMLSAGEERDWWTLNEQSTILRAERSGATLRLGDQIEVRVVRVDTSAGRVDLAPAHEAGDPTTLRPRADAVGRPKRSRAR